MIDNLDSFFLSFTLNRSVVISGRYASSSIFFNWLKWTKLCDKSHRHRRRRLVTSAIRLQSTTRTHYCAFSDNNGDGGGDDARISLHKPPRFLKAFFSLWETQLIGTWARPFPSSSFLLPLQKGYFLLLKEKEQVIQLRLLLLWSHEKKKENHLATIWVASGLAGPGWALLASNCPECLNKVS